MRDRELPEIRRLPLFRDMLSENFARLMQAAYAQTFPPQLDLIEEGRPADFLHVVVEGSVELLAAWNGRETTMAIVRPVGSFILAACMKDVPHLMSARTMEKSRIILIPASDLRAMFRRDADFAMAVTVELAGCYRAVVRHAKTLKLRTARERIAAWVLHEAAQAGGVRSFTLPVEKRLLASFLGMTPENLSRAFKTLEPEGLKIDGARVIVTDPARLALLAVPDPLLDGPDPDGARSGTGLPGVSADRARG